MRIILSLLIFRCTICEVLTNNTTVSHDLQSAYQYLIENENQLILGQWKVNSKHPVYLSINFDSKNFILQVYLRQNNNQREPYFMRLSYLLNNSSYYFDSVQNRMTWKNVLTQITLQINRNHTPQYCKATLELEIQKPKNLQIYSDFDNACQLTEEKIYLYISHNSMQMLIYLALIIFIQMFQIFNSHHYFNSDPRPNQGGSITMSIILTQDIYMCIFNILLFDTIGLCFYIPCLGSQMITILFDLKMKVKLAQTANYDMKEIVFFFVQFLIITFLFLQIQNSYGQILLNLILLPQILFTFFTGKRQRFNSNYIGILFPRLLFSLYFTGYSNNILMLKYNIVIFGTIILIFLIQSLIYYFQCHYGLFILSNKKFNYLIKQTNDHSKIDCSICLVNLTSPPELILNSEEPVHIQTLNMATQLQLLMSTPCNHIFHPFCLIQWMQINLTCPLCKSSLPQIY
ncbi:unnamed protein product (macronuclear) [Paramecium tetraurelia]|uniref:RING-type E3 ubiquitin transferase n=1 Tax=Paramecium tetraurelia TaxID=5888 RepID=A0BDG0_PARTE|nr:uncharacterized protein GSPATT00027605001 [Paramecium tetraurelia]CAK56577.1 unnamed protein product [Paramecium tetraurelia]|eukprot:XP_001423975.1 hypothetical protein (macronuclear) [Paramecium tetraurelia strain d4-2]